jgi:hypothetical protein
MEDKRFAPKPQASAAHIQANSPPDWADLPESIREVLYETALKKTYTAARFAPQNASDLRALAEEWYDSDLLPESYYPEWEDKQKRPIVYSHEDLRRLRKRGISRAVIVMRYGAALGVLPEIAIRLIYIIDNQPSPAAALMLAIFLASPVCAVFEPLESTKTSARMRVGRKGQKPFEVAATYEEFKHLHGRKNWTSYPTDMVYSRCLGRAMRRVAPDLFAGVYCAEERVDFRAEKAAGAGDSMLDRILEQVDLEPPAAPRYAAPAEEPEPPAAPSASAEPVAQAAATPAKATPTRRDCDELLELLPKVGDSVTPEEVTALRARVEAFAGFQVSFAKLVATWNANENLGAWVAS